jgi:hypothetical protein
MNSAKYIVWIEVNCPISISKDSFTAFLIMKTIDFIELSSKNSGREIQSVIYEASDQYKDFFQEV